MFGGMDQSTINQFFVTRKSSSSSCLPASKRRKVDVTRVAKEETKERVVRAKPITKPVTKSKPSTNNRKTTKANIKNTKPCSKGGKNFIDINTLFNAKPLILKESKTKLPGSTESEILEDDVFTTLKSKSVSVEASKDTDNKEVSIKECPRTPIKPMMPSGTDSKEGQTNKKCQVVTPVKAMSNSPKLAGRKGTQLPFNDDVNDQAKTILFSRGSTILKAGFDKHLLKSPSKVSEILNCLSPHKNPSTSSCSRLTVTGSPNKIQLLNSPRKLSDVLNTLSPQKLPKTVDTSSQSLPSSVLTATNKSNDSKPAASNTDRRARLRNKFKHLLQDENTSAPTESNASIQIKNATSSQNDTERPTTTAVKEKAHAKFKHLTQKSIPQSFILPQKYKVLVELFRCVDSILFLLNQRSEICTFDKLKKSVQSMSGKDFNSNHLAAMKTIYPSGFTFRQEKGLHTAKDLGKSDAYQLTVEANFKEFSTSNSSKINSNVLITRRLCFENELLDIVKAHHQKFLRKLNMKICDSEIHRWHPHFKVNEVPDVELSNLPQAPINKGFTSAADLILRNKVNLAPKVQTALLNAANRTQSEPDQNKIDTTTNTATNPSKTKPKTNSTNTKLRGVSMSLLERIRQKEQSKMALAMTRDPEQEEKLSKMQRLPDISRILKSFFTAEKKVAITLEDCVQKLSESYGTALNLVKLEEHVRMLSELVPHWITIVHVRKFPFVKLAKGYDINKVINLLNTMQTKESEG